MKISTSPRKSASPRRSSASGPFITWIDAICSHYRMTARDLTRLLPESGRTREPACASRRRNDLTAATGDRQHDLRNQGPTATVGIGRCPLPNKSEREPIVGVDARSSSLARAWLIVDRRTACVKAAAPWPSRGGGSVAWFRGRREEHLRLVGQVGVAAAILNAVRHATGRRVRELRLVAVIALWWEDWPGSRQRPGSSGLTDTSLIGARWPCRTS